jgi:hypothetical protein
MGRNVPFGNDFVQSAQNFDYDQAEANQYEQTDPECRGELF